MTSIETAGDKPGEDVYLALDCASTEYFKDGVYDLAGEGKKLGITSSALPCACRSSGNRAPT